MYFHIFSTRERNEPLFFLCDCVLRGCAAPAMNKETRGPRCELPGCSVVEAPDNTYFRCSAISEKAYLQLNLLLLLRERQVFIIGHLNTVVQCAVSTTDCTPCGFINACQRGYSATMKL